MPSASSDPVRVLSPEGAQQTRRAARGLATLIRGDVRLIASPYVRTQQTAEILEAALAPGAGVESCDALALGGEDHAVLQVVVDGTTRHTIVLVGHEPTLASLTSMLLLGNRGLDVHFQRACAVCIEFAGVPSFGQGRLAWSLPPDVLVRLAPQPTK